MGQAISTVRSSIQSTDEEVKARAQQDLDILAKAIDSQLKEFEAKLESKFSNPSPETTEVRGSRPIRKVRCSEVRVRGAPPKDVSSAIDQLLNIGKSENDPNRAILRGFKRVVEGGLSAFVNSTAVGQHKEEKYFIYMQHNALVRLDILLWRWNFVGKGFSDTYESAFGYLVCTSVVDVMALKTSEFAFLISEYSGDDEDEVGRYATKMAKMYETARRLKAGQERDERRRLNADDAMET